MKTVMKSSSYKSKHHTGAPESSNNRCIVFSFQHIHEKYCITKCETKEQVSFLEKVKRLGKLTWQDCRDAGNKHGLGYEKIKTINVAIPQSLLGKDDITFIAFRFFDRKPMVGYREKEIFHIIWFDRDFDVYDHG